MKWHRKIARLFGYEMIKRSNHPTLHSHLINLINLHEIDLVLDVGANSGQFATTLRREGYKGDIHSFEPVSKTFESLRAACSGDPRWFAHNVAMGDACDKKTVNVTAASDFSSFLTPNDFAKETFENVKVLYEEVVEVRTVENFLAIHVVNVEKRRILLKMDTQGYDLEVLEGAIKVRERIVCVVSEISLIPIYSRMPSYLAFLKKGEERGFVVTGFYPVSRKKDLSVIEMDCVLLNGQYADVA